jgi:4-amino-4-deoxy-L-arabinose transferase-like glycosyltransferase
MMNSARKKLKPAFTPSHTGASPVLVPKPESSASKSSGLIQRVRGASIPVGLVDAAVYSYLLVMGLFQLTHYFRSSDLLADATYPELARSILEHASYQIRFLPQTTLPPGLPLILALVGRFAGLTPAVLFSVIAVSATLGLIAAYEFLRRVEGRGIAAVASLLLASSPSMFIFNATVVFPEMPYLLASMLALLLAFKIDRSEYGKALIGWELLLGVVLAFAVLIRSVGIALLAGVFAWTVTSMLWTRPAGKRRLKRFAIPLLLGLVAQLSWGVWAHRHQTLEWQLPGFPESYLSQLKVKDGQYPELGLAHLVDIPGRVAHNAEMRSVAFWEIVTRKHVAAFWPSPAIAGVVLLIIAGLASSFLRGAQLHDWYFLGYEAIFLLWPWETRDRFLFPVVPLTCLYLWRGVKTLWRYSVQQPKISALWLGVVGSFLSFSSAAFALGITGFVAGPSAASDKLQFMLATLFWGILAAAGIATFLFYPRDSADRVRITRRFNRIPRSDTLLFSFRLIAILTVAALMVSGAEQIHARGRDNLNPDITEQAFYPEVEAAEWIRTHEPPDVVLMSREPEFVFHYTHRRVVWFPPISDPKVLMEGIRRYHVGVIIVARHPDSYWWPPEDVCFQSLLRAYKEDFHLSQEGPNYQIFEVKISAGSNVASPSRS